MFKLSKQLSFVTLISICLLSAATQAQVSLNGISTHSELGKELFIAGLYTTTPSTNRNEILVAQEDKQIQVRVTATRMSSRRFKRMWIEGMAVNASPNELKEHSANMAAFNNMMSVRMVQGDVFTVSRESDGDDAGVKVSINGIVLGEISEPSFFDLLLRTWLGPVPLSSDFRASLTQAGNIDAALLARYEATNPSDTRIADMESNIQQRASARSSSRSTPSAASQSTAAVSAPVISAPAAPIVAPPVTLPSPDTDTGENKIAIAPPTIGETTPQNPAPPAETEPAVASAAELIEEEDEEEEDFTELTAESILKQQLYVSQLKRYSNQFLKYPSSALNKGREGNVRLNIVIDRQGNVQNVDVLETSRYTAFTRAAKRAVKKADPFPAVPEEVSGETFTFSLPIVFVLGSGG